jgi:flagellar motility protein MotE (MotC chaperone)
MLMLRIGDIWLAVSQDDSPRAGAPAGEAAAQTEPDQPPALEEGAMAPEGDADAGGAAGGAGQSATPAGMQPLETTDEEALDFEAKGDLRPGELRLMHDLAKRREALEVRERALNDRAALLSAAEQRLVAKQDQLETLRTEIEKLVARFDQSQEDEASVLRQTYQNMKPKSAASIFNDLDMPTLLDVVRGMPARRLAPILAAMNTEKARMVTQELAMREDLPSLPQ